MVDILNQWSNGGNREKKNVWMMNETCSEKIRLLCQRLHFKSLSGFLNWIVFNVDGGSPIHNHSQTLPMKKARKKKFDQMIRDFENVLVKRYKPALKRSTNLLKLLRTALKLTKEVMKAEGNTESISDNQAMMHLTSLLSGNRSGIKLNPTKCLDQRWVAPWLYSCQCKRNQRSSVFQAGKSLESKEGRATVQGSQAMSQNDVQTKTIVTQAMKARTGIRCMQLVQVHSFLCLKLAKC